MLYQHKSIKNKPLLYLQRHFWKCKHVCLMLSHRVPSRPCAPTSKKVHQTVFLLRGWVGSWHEIIRMYVHVPMVKLPNVIVQQSTKSVPA